MRSPVAGHTPTEQLWVLNQLQDMAKDVQELTKAVFVVGEQVKANRENLNEIKHELSDLKNELRSLLKDRDERKGAHSVLAMWGKPAAIAAISMILTVAGMKDNTDKQISPAFVEEVQNAEKITKLMGEKE